MYYKNIMTILKLFRMVVKGYLAFLKDLELCKIEDKDETGKNVENILKIIVNILKFRTYYNL